MVPLCLPVLLASPGSCPAHLYIHLLCWCCHLFGFFLRHRGPAIGPALSSSLLRAPVLPLLSPRECKEDTGRHYSNMRRRCCWRAGPRDLSAKISRQRRGFSRSRRNLVGSLQPPPAASSVSCDGRLTAFVNILTTGEGFFGRNSSSSLPEAKRQAGKELRRTQRDQVPITPPRDGPQPRHCLGVWALCTGHLWCLWRPQSRQLGCKEQGHTQSEMLWHPYGRPMLQAATWRAVS